MPYKSNSREEDERLASRVDKKYGGEMVEAIAPDDLELINQPDCKHETWTRDPSETDFIAFVCDNPKCGEVKLYAKP